MCSIHLTIVERQIRYWFSFAASSSVQRYMILLSGDVIMYINEGS